MEKMAHLGKKDKLAFSSLIFHINNGLKKDTLKMKFAMQSLKV